MDALIKKAIESLIRKSLPELQENLSRIHESHSNGEKISIDSETIAIVEECRELLGIVQADFSPQNKPHQSEDQEELSDEEATALMAAMEDPSMQGSNAAGAEIAANDSMDDISDEEAMKMLAAMDGEETPPKDDLPMDDEEAMRLLAAMDGSDDKPEDTEISDEEAMRLLSEMDDKPAPASNDIDDDEAARLLAAMDAPAAKTSEPTADDEAEAMLAQMGGADDESTPTVQASAESKAPSKDEVADNEVGEIDEWEANDFQTDPDMINDFISNADEIMEGLDESILKLEQDPENKEIIEEIFRGAHTLKGAGGMFGFRGLERVMHRMENLFDLIRKDKLVPTSDTVDVVFEGLDMLRKLLEAVKDGKPCGAKTAPIVKALEEVAAGKKPTKIAASDSAAEPEQASPETEAKTVAKAAPAQAEGKDRSGASSKTDPAKKKDQSTIRVDLERLDVLVNLVGELVIDRTRFASIEEELRTHHPQIELKGNISETVQLFGRHMNEIQDIIMKVRMVPIGNAFNKFTRIVRDLSRSLDKKIELVINGENAELDKTLVEQIGDPLIHLIRNSCDHGIEMPADRVESGKGETGHIFLSAHQEGNHIVIKIEDDGKGIPAHIIRKKGIEKGLIGEEEQLSDRDIFNLIFEPGFSTAEQVTNISGRGVGMDVVKKQIMKLKGMIEIDSELGKGTTITIRLPLTLAIVQSLLVKSAGETFAIPLATVIESIRVSPEDLQKVGDTEVFKLRDKVLPLIHLDEALGLHRKENSIADQLKKKRLAEEEGGEKSLRKKDRMFIVVVGHADRPTGIIVDQLLNQQEMVIKSMGPLMKNIPCVAGGAVLGHGEVVLVLDVPELEESTKSRNRLAA